MQLSNKPNDRFGRTRLTVAAVAIFMLGMLAGSLTGGASHLSASSSLADTPAFAIFEETWNYVHDQYVLPEELDDTELMYGATRGMVEAVGDVGHSAFLDPAEAQAYNASLGGELIGIGVRLEFTGKYPEILEPLNDSPAEAAGIESGDVILQIDGQDTSRLTSSQIGTLLRGEEGVPVELTIGRPAADIEFEVTIHRARIEIDPVEWARLPDGLFLIRLNEFSDGAGDALAEALDVANATGAVGIVLDMRGNPGGYVHEAKSVASEFLPAGSVLYMEQKRDRTAEPVVLDRQDGRARTIPLTVLVDETSASAAEIVAASLRDNGRAEIIGQPTFGTATVVSSFDLDDGSVVAIGTAVWTAPNGENARNVGISPTVDVDLPPLATELRFEPGTAVSLQEIIDAGDEQLLAAIEILNIESGVATS